MAKVKIEATTSFVAAPYFAKKGDILDISAVKAADIIACGWAKPVAESEAAPKPAAAPEQEMPKKGAKKK